MHGTGWAILNLPQPGPLWVDGCARPWLNPMAHAPVCTGHGLGAHVVHMWFPGSGNHRPWGKGLNVWSSLPTCCSQLPCHLLLSLGGERLKVAANIFFSFTFKGKGRACTALMLLSVQGPQKQGSQL